MSPGRARGSFVARFFRGMGCLPRAVRLIAGSRRLACLSLVPYALSLAIYVGLFVVVLLVADDLTDMIVQPGSWWRTALRFALRVAFPLVFLLVSAFTYAVACLVLAAPLYEFLSAAVEKRLTGRLHDEPFSIRNAAVDIWRALSGALVILLIEVGVLILGVLFVPVSMVLAFLASAVLLSLEYLDYPMGRRRMPLRAKFRFARRHLWECMGLGVPLLLGLAVPFVGVAFLPFGVVGGTVLFVELTAGGAARAD